MLFNTLAFWIFFAVVLGVYLLLGRRRPQYVFILPWDDSPRGFRVTP